jgi:hypothetical protein
MATSEGGGAGRYGGYGQSGYEEEAADQPGVQADFDEEENRQEEITAESTEDTEIRRKSAKWQ